MNEMAQETKPLLMETRTEEEPKQMEPKVQAGRHLTMVELEGQGSTMDLRERGAEGEPISRYAEVEQWDQRPKAEPGDTLES